MRKDLEFTVGDNVFLKIFLVKEIMRFARRGKFSPRFIGLFQILEQVGTTTYCLALPAQLSDIHDVFHVFMLRKYHHDPA